MSEARFAIYFVPAARTRLYAFGAATIGYDCYGGEHVPLSAGLESLPQDWAELTREPRKYGFHATLKAPFRLRKDANQEALVAAFEDFAGQYARGAAAPQFVPHVQLLGGFVAVVPRGDSPAIRELADACVTAFDPFRAPPTDEERQRRLEGRLSDRQIACLDRWGYPYVFDEFRFHMTLTGSLAAERRGDILSRLQTRFAQACGERQIAVDQLALLHQECATARFKVLRQAPIGMSHADIA